MKKIAESITGSSNFLLVTVIASVLLIPAVATSDKTSTATVAKINVKHKRGHALSPPYLPKNNHLIMPAFLGDIL